MTHITETLRGIVNRVTYHDQATGWSILRVSPFASPEQQETVTVHQTRVFAGATMEFHGAWTVHPRYGRQFKATRAIEIKPATAAALEKYLGSGLIKGVGPKTAKKIVRHFGEQTLEVFEQEIERLTEVPGIARGKLMMIEEAWKEHRAIREVMMFLQGHGISTLFAVRIYRKYGDRAIALVSEDPYCLARDIYGIGFFSADRVALSIGLARDS
ncbi:MAG: helix-hairpin-helix domain-containing protein, partial [Desulfobulbaceae bacterium]|nr:helix-hairpin-helix domain-containing protein [Desulfobulbaceae bacterium]